MEGHLDGHVILITGAGSGIGRATAQLAASRGATIAGIDVTRMVSTPPSTPYGSAVALSEGIVTDVTEGTALTSAIDTLASNLGPFDGVFANAAVLPAPVPAGR